MDKIGSKFDIMNMIENWSIESLSEGFYETKLYVELKENLNEQEKKLFLASYRYSQKYNAATDFLVDFSDVWKWCGCEGKIEAVNMLKNGFKADVDYKIDDAENYMLSLNTFKLFCLRAGTKRSDEYMDYYIKVQNVLMKTIIDGNPGIRDQINGAVERGDTL
jgi:hypothetical protein